MKSGGFLNPEAIRTLLNANTDNNAPHFIFMTTHGTILGHSSNFPTRTARKFGAFAGTTWLRHAKSIAATGEASPEPDFGLGGRTAKVVVEGDEQRRLRSLVCVVDGLVGACWGVDVGEKVGLVLGALRRGRAWRGKAELETEDAAIAELLLDEEGEVDSGVGSAEDDGAAGDERSRGEDGDSADGSGSGLDDVKATGLDDGTSDGTSLSSQQTARLPKLRILEIRAETMAKAFAEEICGPDFRMPPDFK